MSARDTPRGASALKARCRSPCCGCACSSSSLLGCGPRDPQGLTIPLHDIQFGLIHPPYHRGDLVEEAHQGHAQGKERCEPGRKRVSQRARADTQRSASASTEVSVQQVASYIHSKAVGCSTHQPKARCVLSEGPGTRPRLCV